MVEFFVPVASRRLGLSLGINHLPPKNLRIFPCVLPARANRYPHYSKRWILQSG